MKRLTNSDWLKIREFVEEQIEALDGKIEKIVEMMTVVKLHVVDCDMMRLEDRLHKTAV